MSKKNRTREAQNESLKDMCFQFGIPYDEVKSLIKAEKEKRILRRRVSIFKLIEETIDKDLANDPA